MSISKLKLGYSLNTCKGTEFLINLFVQQFFIGWWIMIDAEATKVFPPAYHTPGVISSLAVFM